MSILSGGPDVAGKFRRKHSETFPGSEYPEAPLVTLGHCISQWQNGTNTGGKRIGLNY